MPQLASLPLLLAVLSGCLVEPVCYTAEDCAAGQVCDPACGECAPPPAGCAGPGDCPAGQSCVGGRCVPDSTGPLVCPDDMVAVSAGLCVDRYEASRPDASAENAGADTSRAISRAGVLPWHVNPLTPEDVARFDAACRRAGKRLCEADEWYAACAGGEGRPYAFGSVFNRETCNCVDTFCDDYCAEQGISDCSLGDNCGYDHWSFRLMPTGSFPDCIDAYGALDVSGNVWEVVWSATDPRGYEVRGGAYNCAGAAQRLRCTYNAGWDELYAGFRCCKGAQDHGSP